jgi:hypothetical protein
MAIYENSLEQAHPTHGDRWHPSPTHPAAHHVALGAIGQEVLPSATKLVDSAVGTGTRLIQGGQYSIRLTTIKHVSSLLFWKELRNYLVGSSSQPRHARSYFSTMSACLPSTYPCLIPLFPWTLALSSKGILLSQILDALPTTFRIRPA